MFEFSAFNQLSRLYVPINLMTLNEEYTCLNDSKKSDKFILNILSKYCNTADYTADE